MDVRYSNIEYPYGSWSDGMFDIRISNIHVWDLQMDVSNIKYPSVNIHLACHWMDV